MSVSPLQSRLLVRLTYGLAASFALSGVLTNALPLLVGPILVTLIGTPLALRSGPRAAAWLVPGVVVAFCFGMFCLLYVTDKAMEGRYGPSNSAMAVGTPIHALILTALAIWVIRKLEVPRAPQQAPVPPLQPGTPGTPAADASSEPEIHPLDLLLTDDRREWLVKAYPSPLSVRYAASAAAVRALEQGRPWEAAKVDAAAAAKAWTYKPGMEQLRFVTNADLAAAGPWHDVRYEAASQMLAGEAAVLRALELGLDGQKAAEAARATAKAWAPPTSPAAPAPAASGALDGIAYGFMKRTVPFAMTMTRYVRYTDKAVWTFTVQRKGVGENGRPLSPIQVQMEGYKIDGLLEDGDAVRFLEVPQVSVVNTLTRIQNLSKGLELRSTPIQESPAYKEFRIFKTFVALIFVILTFGFLAGFYSAYKKQSAGIEAHFPNHR
jgi:flagellar biogenesis protein FliO